MNWDIERYVRLYRRDTPEWALVPWQARGLFDEILRKASLHGVIECGRLEPGQAVAVAIGAPPGDVPEVTRLLEVLVLDGCIRDVPAAGSHGRHLFIPNYQPANGVALTGAERQARYRAKQQGLFGASDAGDEVTDPSRAEPSLQEKHGGEEHREKVSRLRKHPTTPTGLRLRERWPDVVDPDGLLSRLAEAAPGVDVAGELEKAWAWERAQPRSAQKKAHERFFTNWVLRAAARAPRRDQADGTPGPRRVFDGLDADGKARYRG